MYQKGLYTYEKPGSAFFLSETGAKCERTPRDIAHAAIEADICPVIQFLHRVYLNHYSLERTTLRGRHPHPSPSLSLQHLGVWLVEFYELPASTD